jgi:hypothetical protein
MCPSNEPMSSVLPEPGGATTIGQTGTPFKEWAAIAAKTMRAALMSGSWKFLKRINYFLPIPRSTLIFRHRTNFGDELPIKNLHALFAEPFSFFLTDEHTAAEPHRF